LTQSEYHRIVLGTQNAEHILSVVNHLSSTNSISLIEEPTTLISLIQVDALTLCLLIHQENCFFNCSSAIFNSLSSNSLSRVIMVEGIALFLKKA
jgi:hypothetical protein